MYTCVNSNLLYHGCILMTEDGEFDTVSIGDKTLSGKEYLDYIDTQVRRAYFAAPGRAAQCERLPLVSLVRAQIPAVWQKQNGRI